MNGGMRQATEVVLLCCIASFGILDTWVRENAAGGVLWLYTIVFGLISSVIARWTPTDRAQPFFVRWGRRVQV